MRKWLWESWTLDDAKLLLEQYRRRVMREYSKSNEEGGAKLCRASKVRTERLDSN